ncbi:MAG: YMGG-like glycine zipper-containing protein [Deltaproteobacteria bacterium]|jgi:outer membrane lipoprotein SlyB|nr:YMGG-like glycine zipper-containing protein [Deltaproteobacteria bacterium]
MKAKIFNKVISFFTLCAISCSVWACAQPTQSNYEGAAVGAGVGAVAGALIDKRNPWRGAVVGGALGAVAGGSLAEVSKRAAYEARSSNRPVYYERQMDNGGWQRIEAQPQPQYSRSGNRCVLVKTFENGRVVDEHLSCD